MYYEVETEDAGSRIHVSDLIESPHGARYLTTSPITSIRHFRTA